jgi:hypothetical protein
MSDKINPPSVFTREDVDALREGAGCMGSGYETGEDEKYIESLCESLESIAARIEALLPPENSA